MVTTTVSVVPATATCTGSARLFTFVVNPTPGNPEANSPIVYCATENASALVANGSNLKWLTEATRGMASNLAPTPSYKQLY